jgi:hypothetical protein
MSEPVIIEAAYAYEQASRVRKPPVLKPWQLGSKCHCGKQKIQQEYAGKVVDNDRVTHHFMIIPFLWEILSLPDKKRLLLNHDDSLRNFHS